MDRLSSFTGTHSASALLFRRIKSVSMSRILSMGRPDNSTARLSQVAVDSVMSIRSSDGYFVDPAFNQEEMMKTILLTEELFYEDKIGAFLRAVENGDGGLEIPFRAIAHRIFKQNDQAADISSDLQEHLLKFIHKMAEAPLLVMAKETVRQLLASSDKTTDILLNFSQAPKLFAEPLEDDSPDFIEGVETAIFQLATKMLMAMPGFLVSEPTPVQNNGEKCIALKMTYSQDEERTKHLLTSENYINGLIASIAPRAATSDPNDLDDQYRTLSADLRQAVQNGEKEKIKTLSDSFAEFYEEAAGHLPEEELGELTKQLAAAFTPLYRQYADKILEHIDIPSLMDLPEGEETILLSSYSDEMGDIAELMGDKSEPMPFSEMAVIAQVVVSLNFQLESRYLITPSKWVDNEGRISLCIKIER